MFFFTVTKQDIYVRYRKLTDGIRCNWFIYNYSSQYALHVYNGTLKQQINSYAAG